MRADERTEARTDACTDGRLDEKAGLTWVWFKLPRVNMKPMIQMDGMEHLTLV